MQLRLRTVCQFCSPLRGGIQRSSSFCSRKHFPTEPLAARASSSRPYSSLIFKRMNTAHKDRTPAKAAAKERVRGPGPGYVGPRATAPVRPAVVRVCLRGPEQKWPRPQERRRRRGGTERDPSPAPLFAPLQHKRTRKKGRNRHRLLPSNGRQYSSSMAPWTVCTTRMARCAGSAL